MPRWPQGAPSRCAARRERVKIASLELLQRIRLALAVLQTIAVENAPLSADPIYILKELAESVQELESLRLWLEPLSRANLAVYTVDAGVLSCRTPLTRNNQT